MTPNILQSDLDRQVKNLMDEVFPDARAWFATAANTLFQGLIQGGNTLVTRLAAFVKEGKTAPKGVCERVSGWLGQYDFATPAAEWLAARNAPRVHDDTTLAVDFSDISKAFGGKGMEGMAKGWDGSRHITAMGHTFCAACALAPSRQSVYPLRFCFEKGRKPLGKRLEATLRATLADTQGRGILALDRGCDSEDVLTLLQALDCRAVVRVNHLARDVFGTGQAIDAQLDAEPRANVRLFKPSGPVDAKISFRLGHLGGLHDTPVLLVRSEFDGRALYLYALPGKDAKRLLAHPARFAAAAAQAYLDRWQIEVFFERIKQDFALEDARVRTFKRLKNLFYLCVLGYSFCTDVLPASAAHARMVKIFRDNLHRVTFRMRTFLSGLRVLLEAPRLNFITGRPRKRSAPPLEQALLAF